MAFRDELAAQEARHAALAAEVRQKTRELAEVRQHLEHARAVARLPVLDNLRVAAPCRERWDQMRGDDRTRHCDRCAQSVHDLSELTRAEAEALVVAKNGALCVRYYQRSDGKVMFADCPDGLRRRNRRQLVAAGVATLLAAVGGVAAERVYREPAVDEIDEGDYVVGNVSTALPIGEPPAGPAAPDVEMAPETVTDEPAAPSALGAPHMQRGPAPTRASR